jgi:hypothetical protein
LALVAFSLAGYAGGCAGGAATNVDGGTVDQQDATGSDSTSSSDSGGGGDAVDQQDGAGTDSGAGSSDSGAGDSSSGAGDSSSGDSSGGGGTCSPQDLPDGSVWTEGPPPADPPPKQVLRACSSQDFVDYDNACLGGSATKAACDTWKAGHSGCAACIESQPTDSSWGPIVAYGGVYDINTAGCVQLTDPSNSCATVGNNGMECQHLVCDTACSPVTDPTSLKEWQQCANASYNSDCWRWIVLENGLCAAMNLSGTSMPCAWTPNTPSTTPAAVQGSGQFDTYFLQVAPIFCGAGAGSDGGADATGD